ncbi:uroporphyrinogen-III C-methyltransferase /precorrin-2 dehydrogenase [Marinobacterium halophilum]|uniref:Siroheme synthase n=1 Tax=Marinobacterium halophilum TaxID=267374 RepID=A0A2P8F502_9GAMM|nr:siroheme synthase CysG [Marinobacterium halophilum]PSL16793.1 uroporphyrinogen-III C-methyltransferase /precorrin-2 dehydrogenase [Marinobacterium halophilum]
MDYLPLFFDLKQRPVLMVGGGDIALRKARLLTRAGAHITVVAHAVLPELQQMLDMHHGQVLIGEYHPELIDGKVLVLAATDDDGLNERVHYDAVACNVPVNVVDNPKLCTFVFPAIVDRSPIVIGISSGGQSPVLARLLRAKLETWIPTGYSRLGQLVGRLRDKVKARFDTVNERRVFWESVLQGQVAERVFAGQEAEAEALLEEQIKIGNASHQVGEVYLVGAGPGDPELLTFKALRLMQQADVVLYDRLVSPDVLDLCRRDADLIFVGKQRDNHAVPQEGINQLLIDHALMGKRVVRLKGGDPFIFGRGGEELAELKKAGIPFQVVPGITAASACSSYAGIPLTHRDYAQSVKFVTGQLKNRTTELNYAELIQPNQTIVFYMGLHTLDLLCAGLVAHGKPADTPAAIVSRGTSRDQQVLVGTLATLAQQQAEAQLPAPALVIVGEVVELQSQLSWFGEERSPVST